MKLTLLNSIKSLLHSTTTAPGRLAQQVRNVAYNLYEQSTTSARFRVPQGLQTIGVDAFLPRLDTQICYYTFKPGTSLPLEIAVLKTLAALRPGSRFLEIGSYLGEAIANVADAGATCVSLSLGDEDMVTLGFGGHIENNRFFIKNDPRIQSVSANSHTYDFAALGQFDLVFIDGDHTYEGVLNDTTKVFATCLKPDAVVLWHDYADKSGIRWPVLAAILEGTPADKHNRIFYIENTLSAIYLPASISVQPRGPYNPLAKPQYYFDMEIKLVPVGTQA